MKIGIIGLPNVGKSSLFNLLTQAQAQVANFPFTTIERNIGMAPIADDRLVEISSITQSPKTTYAQIEFVDIAGLIKGASEGEGLGNTFLSHIRDVDLILHVLRCFKDTSVPHTYTDISPQRDYEVVKAELFLADLEIVERRLRKIEKKAESRVELVQLKDIHETLTKGHLPDKPMSGIPLITVKKEIEVLNLDENTRLTLDIPGFKISIRMEEDIAEMTESEKRELRIDIGADPGGPAGLIDCCLKDLALITFYTVKGDETRAWLLPTGATALDAAGKIHKDMQEGFIKAEVVTYNDFVAAKGFSRAQHTGKTRIEGKEYIVQDGDIILIKFRN